MRFATGDMTTDFSQLEFRPGAGGTVVGPVDLGLASDQISDDVILTVPRQHGTLTVVAQVHAARPDLDPGWDAVIEWSVRTGNGMNVSGWAGENPLTIEVPAGRDMRVRYVVLDGQEGAEQSRDGRWDEPPIERYLLQVWPQAPAAACVLAATSPWSQYWSYGPQAASLVADLAGVPDPQRLVVLIDRALAAHPDVIARLLAGDDRYRIGVVRYVQELFRVTHHTGAYDELRDDHKRIGSLIAERARAASG